jgi:hypothetical protein
MYVADVTDLAELQEMLSESKCRLWDSRYGAQQEQAIWDIEDIENRIKEIS